MIKNAVKCTVIAAIWLTIWQLVAMIVGKELLFPSPLSVLSRLLEMLATADFYKTVGISVLRVTLGMIIGLLLGAVGGTLSAFVKPARDFFAPMLAIIKSTPVASFIILLVLWLSRDITPIVISAIMVLPVVWSNVEMGFSMTDKGLLELAQVYQMPRARKTTQIYLPNVFPYFLSAMRSSLGMSWKAGIAAEVLLQPLISIGKQISDAKYTLETVDLFAWTAVVIILSVIIEKLIVLLFSRSFSGQRKDGANG